MVATPNTATATNIVRPARRRIGARISHSAIASAPIALLERSSPRPHGPCPRMSFAKIGSSAVAPPSSTAKRSSEIAPSTGGRLRMKRMPANTESSVTLPGGAGGARKRINCTSRPVTRNSTTLAPYTAAGPAT